MHGFAYRWCLNVYMEDKRQPCLQLAVYWCAVRLYVADWYKTFVQNWDLCPMRWPQQNHLLVEGKVSVIRRWKKWQDLVTALVQLLTGTAVRKWQTGTEVWNGGTATEGTSSLPVPYGTISAYYEYYCSAVKKSKRYKTGGCYCEYACPQVLEYCPYQ